MSGSRIAVFALKFHTDSGAVVTAPDMKHQRLRQRADRRARACSPTASRSCTCLPGTYHVTVGIYDSTQQHVYDERFREFELTVQTGTIRATNEGWFDLGGQWSHPGTRPQAVAADSGDAGSS